MILTALILAATIFASATPANDLAAKLNAAAVAGDTRLTREACAVLQDALDHKYSHWASDREAAVDYIMMLKMVDQAPLLRSVAAMDYSSSNRPGELLADLSVISEALVALTTWRDPEAASLNRDRIHSHEALQTVAIRNLAVLQDWAATAAVEDLLLAAPVDEQRAGPLLRAATYLVEAPNTSDGLCPRVQRLLVAIRAVPLDPLRRDELEFCLKQLAVRKNCG